MVTKKIIWTAQKPLATLSMRETAPSLRGCGSSVVTLLAVPKQDQPHSPHCAAFKRRPRPRSLDALAFCLFSTFYFGVLVLLGMAS